MKDIPFRSKEVSWLSFNARVLQEAENDSVPLMERLKYLGIYSSNLDEFFRVRVATLRRLVQLKIPYEKLGIPDPNRTLKKVLSILKSDGKRFNEAYHTVLEKLEKEEKIRLITEQEVPEEMADRLEDFFDSEVLPRLMPINIRANSELSGLKDHSMYLAVRMGRSKASSRYGHALLEMPEDLPRFHVLGQLDDHDLVMYLDDVIRYGLHKVFESTTYDSFESYALKFTRDAEMELDQDFTESFYEQLTESLRMRDAANPVRVNYDADMPESFLKMVIGALDLTDEDTQFPGARYHNRRDLMKFPKLGRRHLLYERTTPIPHPQLRGEGVANIMKTLRSRDLLLHLPYHSFNRFLDLLRQASIDPLVKRISLTQYRLAKKSCVARALSTAVRNGKEVTVLVEPTARFDEEANIQWANQYRRDGISVILGVPGLKVHTKLCLIERLENGQTRRYSAIGTGNFNEDTARLYTDHLLLTANQEIGSDVRKIFDFFRRNFDIPKLNHLICAPFTFRRDLYAMIQREINHARAGDHAEITIKINNLSDLETVTHLYRAAQAGVKLRLIVRGMFSFKTGVPGVSDDVKAIGIVDKFLEHTRILVFHNGGEPRYFLSSADFLPRNFDSRCETLCPIYDKRLQKQLEDYLVLQWRDGVKARLLDEKLTNTINKPKTKPVRAQVATEEYLRKLLNKR